MPSRQIQHDRPQLILTLNLEHNRASGLQAAAYLAHQGFTFMTTSVISSHCGLSATNACSRSAIRLQISAALSQRGSFAAAPQGASPTS
jgi:hypothetical protein